MNLKKVEGTPYYLSYPMITPLITSQAGGKENVMTATWTTPVSIDPPLYAVSIAPSRFSHQLIEDSGNFGVCFMDFQDVEKVLKAGRMSGKNADKFEKLNLEKKKATEINAPLIADAISALECKLTHSPKLGDHTLFVGKVVASWVQQGTLKDNVLDLKKVDPVFYLGSNRFTTTKEWDKLVSK